MLNSELRIQIIPYRIKWNLCKGGYENSKTGSGVARGLWKKRSLKMVVLCCSNTV